jgi:hypothetical protein
METTTLSADALSLLHRRLAGEWVEVTAETLPLYRELSAAGLMYPISTFTRGPEGHLRFSEEGWAMRASVAAAPPAGSS